MVESLAHRQAVDPELGAERRSGGGELLADQRELAAEQLVDHPERVGERTAVAGWTADHLLQGDDRDRSGDLRLVLAPSRVSFDQSREDLVALGVP
jgi:hypothetical protein